MIFTPLGTLKVAGDCYVIPIRLQSSAIYNKSLFIVNKVRNITTLFTAMKDGEGKRYLMDLAFNYKTEFEETLNQLDELLQHYFSKSNPIDNKLKRKRSKRGAVAHLMIAGISATIGGMIGYNAYKIDEVHEAIDALKSDVVTIDSQINLHSHILNTTSTQTINNAQAIVELEIAHNKTLALLREFGDSLAELRAVQRSYAIFLHMQLALTSFKEESRMLDVALDELMENYLHPFILDNNNLMDVLTDIENNSFHLLFPPEKANLRLFREVTQIEYRFSRVNGTLMIYLIVPLLSSPLYSFTTYAVTSFPMAVDPTNETDIFATVVVDHQYISISSDEHHYMLHHTLDHCKSHTDLFVCPPSTAIYASDVSSCEANMFFNRTHIQGLCNYKLKKLRQPTFQLLKGQWLYTTPKNMSLLVQCHHKEPHKILLTDRTGLLDLPESCSASALELFLPSSSMSMATEPMVMSSPFNRTDRFLASNELLSEVKLYDYVVNDLLYDTSSALEINSNILPLVQRMAVIHSEASKVPLHTDHFTYGITVIVTIILLGQLYSWFRGYACCCSRGSNYDPALYRSPLRHPATVHLRTTTDRSTDTPRPTMGMMQRLAMSAQTSEL